MKERFGTLGAMITYAAIMSSKKRSRPRPRKIKIRPSKITIIKSKRKMLSKLTEVHG